MVFTPDQYLELERAAEFRSEYIEGQIVAMSGGSLNHGMVVGDLFGSLWTQLSGKDCTVIATDLRVQSAGRRMYTYPDIVVYCGQEKLADKRSDTLTDATFIAEVLSPSTRSWDLGQKFLYYRTLPSLREYLLIEQHRVEAHHYVRQADDAWMLRRIAESEALVELNSIGCSFVLGDLYRRVDLPPDDLTD